MGINEDGTANNNIINSGSIATSGEASFGIGSLLSTNSNITNSGTITTSGFYGIGISLDSLSNNTTSNSGTIMTGGDLAYGMVAAFTTNSNISNSGTISVAGEVASGILLDSSSNLNITNSGLISTTEVGVNITNSSGFTNTFVNTSTGRVTSEQRPAFIGGDGIEHVENAGRLETQVTEGTAVNLGGGDDTLLLPPDLGYYGQRAGRGRDGHLHPWRQRQL
jgi:hypothetical protein